MIALPLAVAAPLFSVPSSAHPQIQVTGKAVTEETQNPIENVLITVVDAGGDEVATELTSAAGQFAILVDDTPSLRVRAERLGFGTIFSPPLDVDGFRSLSVEIRLRPDAVAVSPVEVLAKRRTSFMLDEFHRRREVGFGEYVTREEIERRSPTRVTDVLRELSGVSVASSGRGTHGVVTMDRANHSFSGRCPAQVYVDGFHLNKSDGRTFRIDDAVAPGDVAGIEVYRGLSTVPPEFLSPKADCGVVVIWTRRSSG